MNETLIHDLYKDQSHFNASLDKNDALCVSNASCGDDVNLSVEIKDGKILKSSFSGSACSITLASAEFLCRSLEGKSISEIDPAKMQKECLTAFDMLTKERRVLCAILPYHALVGLKQQIKQI